MPILKSRKSNISAAVLLASLLTAPVQGGSKAFKIPKRQSFKQEAMDYKACRKQILKDKLKKNAAGRALSLCKEQYPGGSTAIECKRKALKDHKANSSAMRQALKTCKRNQRSITFDPHSPVPFIITDELLYYAGLGLNLPQKFEKSKFGNYKCEHLESYLNEGLNAEYLLFGNSPKIFDRFKKMPFKKVMSVLGIKSGGQAAKKSFQISQTFGKIYDIADEKKIASYFPISFCYFARRLGPHFEGIKVYYLPDRKSNFIVPYFGISFFKETSKTTVKPLAKMIAAALGHGYKVQVNKEAYIYIAQNPFDAFDETGDPYNLCLTPDKNPYIGLIRKRDGGNLPEYVVIANIKNLCRYGERLASRISD